MKNLIVAFACISFLRGFMAPTPQINCAPLASYVRLDDPVDLNQYVGKYKFEGLPFEYVTISVKEGKLIMNTGTGEAALTSVKDATNIFDANGQATLTIARDAAQKVNGLKLKAQGFAFDGKKEA